MTKRGDDIAPWFRAMPPGWQKGLMIALDGGAWEGELAPMAGDDFVYVFFVHASFREAVVEALRKNDSERN